MPDVPGSRCLPVPFRLEVGWSPVEHGSLPTSVAAESSRSARARPAYGSLCGESLSSGEASGGEVRLADFPAFILPRAWIGDISLLLFLFFLLILTTGVTGGNNMATGTGDGSVKSAQDLVARVTADPALAEEIKQNPAAAIARVASQQIPDTTIYRMVVGALGITVIIAILGSIVLVAIGKTTPDAAVALGSAAVGALAGLLAPSPKQ